MIIDNQKENQHMHIFEYLKSMLSPSDEPLTPLPRVAKITSCQGFGDKNSYIQGVICS